MARFKQTARKTTGGKTPRKQATAVKKPRTGKEGAVLVATEKRRHKVLKNNLMGVGKPAIRRMARRGGVKRISG